MRRTRWISGLLLTGVAAAPPAAAFAANAQVISTGASGSDVARLQSILVNAGSSYGDREEAARRLIARDAPEARAQVHTDLQSGDPTTRFALVNAIAAASDPDAALIPTLGQLLGSKGELTRAAATALVNYRDHPEVFDPLRKFAGDLTNPAPQRSAVVGAMGSLVDQNTARFLIMRLQDPKESGEVRRAVTEALGTMTGLDYGPSAIAWAQWWTNAGAGSPDHFVAEALKGREKKNALLQLRLVRLTEESRRLLERNYLKIRDNQPNDADATLLSYLNSTSPEIRSLGASQDFSGRAPSEMIKTRLREMIGDSDDSVRLEVVTVVLTINDRRALHPLMDQLNVERDSRIVLSIMKALGKIEDPVAVPVLLKLVHDPQLGIATAAAREIAGPLGEKLDRPAAASASADLRAMVESISNNPAADELRAACMAALATLKDPASEQTFIDSIRKPGETPEVIRAAVDGIGNLGDTKTEDLIAQELDNQDRDTRLAAARALLHVATPNVANTLYAKLKTETDTQQVAPAIWKAFKGLFDKLTTKELKNWADQFQNDNDAPKRLDTLIALADALAKDHNDGEIASTNQNIADCYMKLNPPDPGNAIASLKKAIDYWQEKAPDEGHLDAAIDQMMQYQLEAGNFSDAVDFADDEIKKHPAYQRAVIVPLKDKANQLIENVNATADDINNAHTIVTKTLQISNLDSRYAGQFQDLLQSIQRKIATQAAPASH